LTRGGIELAENSRWCGKGAEALGLAGPVDEEAFRALCRGEHPETGAQLVEPRSFKDPETGQEVVVHRAGNDATFSAPKTVSVAYAAGVEGVKEAHDAAVLAVGRYLEKHYSFCRSPEGLRPGAVVAAKFDHATSRELDPQLHSHLFILNVARTTEGAWRANEPRPIYRVQKSLGLLYRQELARELTAAGFEVEIRDREQMFLELKGVDPSLADHFSSRAAEIERQMAAWEEANRFPGASRARLHEMAVLETREAKRQVTREEVLRSFEAGFERCGTSMERVREELELSRDGERELPPAEQAPELVREAARELTEREAAFTRAQLLDQAVRLSGGRHPVEELDHALGGADGVLKLGRDRHGREWYSTPEMAALEAGNLEQVRALSAAPFHPLIGRVEIEAFRDGLAREGVRLTRGQWREFENEVAGKDGVILTLGGAGTAKTSTLRLVERFNDEVLRPTGREHHAVNLACTGKAARELSLATGRPAFTVDAFLNASPVSAFDLQREEAGSARVVVAGEEVAIPKEEPVVLRVDEASFLGAKQAGELLRVVEALRERGVEAKLHLLGDTKQMQAVQAGDFLRQVEELGVRREVGYAHLTEIVRQRDPELLEIARGLNREDRELSENAREALGALEKRGSVVEIPELRDLKSAAVQCYLEESGKPSRIPEKEAAGERQSVLLVTATNAQRRELNLEIREARVAVGEIEEGRSFPVLHPVSQGATVEGYQVGDTILFCGFRDKEGKVQRWGARLGTEGRVTGIDRERNRLEVSYSFSSRTRDGLVTRDVVKGFSAAELEGKTALFREEERAFAAGDRIITLKNDAKLGVQNGTLGVIKELDEKGKGVIDVGGKEIPLDLGRYRQIDHAYAVTIHKSQGATVEHSIMYAPVRPDRELSVEKGAEHFGRASYNALNVAVTRAQYEAQVFTNSMEGLSRCVELVDQKISTLATKLREQEGAERLRDLGKSIEELHRAVREPARKVRMSGPEVQVPEVPGAGRGVQEGKRAPVREVAVPKPAQPQGPKVVGRELELTLPKRFGMDLEK